MNTPVSSDLLIIYFSGQATAFQKRLIDEWAADPAHRDEFFAALTAWENKHPQYVTDVDSAIQRHQTRMADFWAMPPAEPDTTPVIELPVRRFGWVIWAAASIAFVLLAGWGIRDRLQYIQYQTAYGQTHPITLPDGSRVVLNANSRLQVPRFGFGRFGREVLLAGEASFAVTHTPDDQPFVVRTPQQFSVLVLGTEFTVYTRRQGGRVVLNKGRVKLNYRDGPTDHQLLMKPGDLVTLDGRGHAQRQHLPEPETRSAWEHNRYVFSNTTLREIGQLFADNYGLQLSLADPELADWTVSGAFTATSSNELLDVLMAASSLTYTRTGNQICISKTTN